MPRSEFKLDMGRFLAGVREQIRSFTNEAAVGIHSEIVQRTPIDTGRAKASWNINAGSENTTVYPVIPEDNKIPRAVAEAIAFEDHPKILENKNPVVVISNDLSYITDLEYGKSGQAPQGMVRLTLADFEAFPASFTQKPF